MIRNINFKNRNLITKTTTLFRNLLPSNRKLNSELKELNNKKEKITKEVEENLRSYGETLNKIVDLSGKYRDFIKNPEKYAENQLKDEFFDLIQCKLDKDRYENIIESQKLQYKKIVHRIKEIESSRTV